MTICSGALPWVLIAGLLALVVFWRVVRGLLRLAARALLGFGFLLLWAKSGFAAGLALGVNAFNALTLGVLGAPGLGLLLAVKWLGT